MRRTFDAVAFGALAFLLAYAAPMLFEVPLPWYLPLERRWIFVVKPSVLGMGWYGLTAFALIAGALSASLAFLFSPKNAVLSAARSKVLALLVAAAALGTGSIYVQELIHRVPK